MIDIFKDDLVNLHDLPDLLPVSRRGKKTHVSTVLRWALHGSRGHILETVSVGGSRYTTRAAVAKFCAAVARGKPAAPAPAELVASAKAAGAELDSLGW